MTFDPHRALHGAAARPAERAPFDRLWARGRRRRTIMRTSGALAGIAAIGLAATLLPGVLADDRDGDLEVADQPPAVCPVTDASRTQFTPPDPYPPTPSIPDTTWYGTPELWTVIPDTPGVQKSVWWSTRFEGGATEERPEIEVRYERLDDPDHDPIVHEAPGTNAHTAVGGWFMINGLQPNEPGCWQVTASYRGEELSYTYLIEGPTPGSADRAPGLTDEQLAGEAPIEDPTDGAPRFDDPDLAGLCEEVDNDFADDASGAPTPEHAIMAFIGENSILQDTTIIGTTITHRGRTVGRINLTGSPANGYHVTRANWCYPDPTE